MNSFFFTIILSVLVNLIIKPAWVFTENKIQDYLGHEIIGIYAAVFSFSSMLMVLTDLGINQWNIKEFSGKKLALQQQISKIWGSKIVLSLIFFVISFLLAWLLGYSLYHLQLLLWISLYQILISAIQLQRSHLQALQLFRLDTLLGNLDKAILLVLCLLLIHLQLLTFQNFIYCLLFSAIFPFVFGAILLHQHLIIPTIQWDFAFLKNISKQFLPFALMTILFSTNEKINQVLIEKISGDVESGLFAGAYRWNNAIAMYLWTILPIFFAKFANHAKEPEKLQKLFQLGWVIVAIPILFVACWIQFYGEFLFIQFENSKLEELQKMVLLLKILIWTVALNASFNIFSTWLTASGFVKQTNQMLLLALIANILFSIALIPNYQSIGGAIALLLAFIVQSFGFFYQFLTHKNFMLEPKIFFYSFGVLLGGIFLLSMGYFFEWNWFFNTLLSTSCIALFLFFLKLIPWKANY